MRMAAASGTFKRQRSSTDENLEGLASDDIFSLLSPLSSGKEKPEGGGDWLDSLTPVGGEELPGTSAQGARSASAPATSDSFVNLLFSGDAGTDAATGESLASATVLAENGTLESIGRPPTIPSQDEMDAHVASLPQHYAFTTSLTDRQLHVRMINRLRAEGPAATVLTSWVSLQDPKGGYLVKLHAVFRDRYAAAQPARAPVQPLPYIKASAELAVCTWMHFLLLRAAKRASARPLRAPCFRAFRTPALPPHVPPHVPRTPAHARARPRTPTCGVA